MNKLWIAVVAWGAVSLGNLSFAAEPEVQQKKAAASTPAKHATKQSATVKSKSNAAQSAAALPTAVAPMAVEQAQTTPPAPHEVHTGHMVCELGNSVMVTRDPLQAEQFIVEIKKIKFYMTPVATSTGAVRLEDVQAGAVWIQLPNKSMLMNHKLGQRMADECQSQHQSTVAQAMKLNPPPNLLVDNPALAKK